MTKEEILEKSRKENKGKDLPARHEQLAGWNAAFLCGLAAIVLILTVQTFTDHIEESRCILAVLFFMSFGNNLRIGFSKHNFKDRIFYLVLAGLFFVMGIFAMTLYFKYLLG